jgi:hypothetical protein
MTKAIRKCIQIIFMFVFFMQVFTGIAKASQGSSIQGFKEWKSAKINSVIQQTQITKSVLLKTRTLGPAKNIPVLEKQLSQLNWNLEVARDLSVTDYFVLYLSQQPQADRFKLAASKLTTGEVADLMQAYAQSLSVIPNSALETISPSNLSSQALISNQDSAK